jgi:hypothetical protein
MDRLVTENLGCELKSIHTDRLPRSCCPTHNWQLNRDKMLTLTAFLSIPRKARVNVAWLSSVSSDTSCTLTVTITCTYWMQPAPQWNDATGISQKLTTAVRNGRVDDLSERLALPVQYRETFGDSPACIPQRTMPKPATMWLTCHSSDWMEG